MAGTIDRGTLDRLIALGRRRGELTTDDLRAVLPIDDMDVDALVLVMLELDAAGVGIEPDALGPRRDQPLPSTFEWSASSIGGPQPAETVEVGRVPTIAAPSPSDTVGVQVSPREAAEADAVGHVVLLSGLVVLLVLGTILVLL